MSKYSGKGGYRVGRWGDAVTTWDLSAQQINQFERVALADGSYALAVSGAIDVRGKRVTGIKSPAVSSGYRLGRGRGGVSITRLNDETWTMLVAPSNASTYRYRRQRSRAEFAILDLADGSLVLVDGSGAWKLDPAATRAEGTGQSVFKLVRLLFFTQDFMP